MATSLFSKYYLLATLLLLFFSNEVVCQDAKSYISSNQEIYQFIGRNLQYPRNARLLNIQGKVIVQFELDENGETKNVEIIRSMNPSLDMQAKLLISLLPPIDPNANLSIKYDQTNYFPVVFKLPGQRHFFNEGMGYYRSGKYKKSLKRLNAVLRLSESYSAAHYYKGLCLLKMDDELGWESIKKAAALNDYEAISFLKSKAD